MLRVVLSSAIAVSWLAGQAVTPSSAFQIDQVDFVESAGAKAGQMGPRVEFARYTKGRRASGAKGEISIWPRLGMNGADRMEQTFFREDGTHLVHSRSDVGTKTTVGKPFNEFLRDALDPSQQCMKTIGGVLASPASYEGEEALHGFTVFKLRRNSGNSRSTEWLAPVLGCERIARVVEFLDPAGNVISRNTLETVSVRLGEPDSRLFQAPRDHDEVGTWEEYRRDYHARMGSGDPPVPFADSLTPRRKAHLEQLERAYQRNKQRPRP